MGLGMEDFVNEKKEEKERGFGLRDLENHTQHESARGKR